MKEKRKVPEIRFLEFNDEWLIDNLGELTYVYDGTHQTPNYVNDGIMFLSVENIKTLKSKKYISLEDFYDDFRIYPEKGDVLMTRIGDIGTANVVETNQLLAYYVSLALFKKKTLASYFLKESINSDFVQKGLWHRTLHIAFPKKINKNEIEKVLIPYPENVKEQQKIGIFFRQLDQLIEHQEAKLKKVTQLKAAMLDKMFPKEGSRVPEIRFKGFEGEWEEKKVMEVCAISTGKSNTQDKNDKGDYPFYVRSPIIERSTKFLYNEEAVLTVGDGVGTGKVFHYVKGKYDLHQRVYRMYNFQEILGKYFYYVFSMNFYNRVMSMTAKTSVDSVRMEMISEMKILMPKLSEQKLIVNFFNEKDKLIQLQGQKLEKLRHIKKSLLSKMFVSSGS